MAAMPSSSPTSSYVMSATTTNRHYRTRRSMATHDDSSNASSLDAVSFASTHLYSRSVQCSTTSSTSSTKSLSTIEIHPKRLTLMRTLSTPTCCSTTTLHIARYRTSSKGRKDSSTQSTQRLVQNGSVSSERLCVVKRYHHPTVDREADVEGARAGEGAGATVAVDGAFVAQESQEGDVLQQMLQELDILQSLHHPSLVNVWGVCTDSKAVDSTRKSLGLALVMDACTCTLREWLGMDTIQTSFKAYIIDDVLALRPSAQTWLNDVLMTDVARGMNALHCAHPHPIVHHTLGIDTVYIRVAQGNSVLTPRSIRAMVGGLSGAVTRHSFSSLTASSRHSSSSSTVGLLGRAESCESTRTVSDGEVPLMETTDLMLDTIVPSCTYVTGQGADVLSYGQLLEVVSRADPCSQPHFSELASLYSTPMYAQAHTFSEIVTMMEIRSCTGVLATLCTHGNDMATGQHTPIPPLHLLPECRVIMEAVPTDVLDLQLMANFVEFERMLSGGRGRIRIVHLSMHGLSSTIHAPCTHYMFADSDTFGESMNAVTAHDLAVVLGRYARQYVSPVDRRSAWTSLECVVLNTCYSVVLGQLLIDQGIRCVIAWETQVEDTACTIFAKAFYTALTHQPTDYAYAFDYGCQMLCTNGYRLAEPEGHTGEEGEGWDEYEVREGDPRAIAAGVPRFFGVGEQGGGLK